MTGSSGGPRGLWAWPAVRLAAAIRHREVSPVEAVEAVLERIARLNPRLNAFTTVTADSARAAARQAEAAVTRGDPLGPLHGVPVSIKDTLDVAGVTTTMGSRLHAGDPPAAADSVAVARLRAAGAIVVGKTTTPEYAHRGSTDSPLFGPTPNPWVPGHTAGGSSGGAGVAAATGLGPVALGTDEGGSVRIPAAFCGVVGLKPTFGLVPRVPVGVAELLTHLGPLTRTVEDAALALSVLAGRDDRDGYSLPGPARDYVAGLAQPLGRPRLAFSPRLGHAAVDPEVLAAVTAAVRALEGLGFTVEEADPGFEDPAAIADALRHPGLAAALGPRLPEWRDRLDPSLVALVESGQRMTAADVSRALAGRHRLWIAMDRFFQRFDLLATPATAVPPFPLGRPFPAEIEGRPATRRGWTPFTYPFNLTGLPAIVLPCGRTRDGRPLAFQLVARRLEDGFLLRAAAAFEAARPWAAAWPDVAGPAP